MKNLLNKYIHCILNEGAKGPIELPDNVFVALEDFGGGDYSVYFADSDGFMLENPAKTIAGEVFIAHALIDCDGAFEVIRSHATQGWGPLLYDIAMEIATERGGGLISDRKQVSNAALKVWTYYLNNRTDIAKIPVKQECNPDVGNPTGALSYRYLKRNSNVTSELKNTGRFLVV